MVQVNGAHCCRSSDRPLTRSQDVSSSDTCAVRPTTTLLSLPPEILVHLASHLHTTQDYLSLSSASRQLRACCLSLRPKALRLLMERTLEQALDKTMVSHYIAALENCKFCDWFFADEQNRRKYANTSTTRRYNLILNHQTKDICGGCLTLALVLRYCWYPWFGRAPNELRISYLDAIRKRVCDSEKYAHQTF